MSYPSEVLKELMDNVSDDVRKRNPDLKVDMKNGTVLKPLTFEQACVELGKHTPKPSKYHNQRTNGYASQKESDYADQLAIRQKAGEVWFWLEQVPFKLPGGVKHRVDFLVFFIPSPNPIRWELVEIKGRDLPMGKLKRKQVEDIYHVSITVI